MATESRHISEWIGRRADEVYDYASDPANLPQWAPGLGSSVENSGGQWFVQTSMGRVGFAFVPRNVRQQQCQRHDRAEEDKLRRGKVRGHDEIQAGGEHVALVEHRPQECPVQERRRGACATCRLATAAHPPDGTSVASRSARLAWPTEQVRPAAAGSGLGYSHWVPVRAVVVQPDFSRAEAVR
jgi:hypothetical protein